MLKKLIKDYSIGSINGNQYSSALHDDLLPLCSLYRTSTAGKREQLKCATHTKQNNKIKNLLSITGDPIPALLYKRHKPIL